VLRKTCLIYSNKCIFYNPEYQNALTQPDMRFIRIESGPVPLFTLRKIVLFFLLLASGCKEPAYFISSNELNKEKVILYLRDQSRIPGTLTISLENFYNLDVDSKTSIRFTPGGDSTEENINLKTIEGYSIGPDFYALKKLDLFMNNTFYLLFVKRLTAERSKIQLYELYESGRGNNTGEIKYSYYLSLPSYGPLETMNTRSSGLVPFFDEKMSEIVHDCPALSQKIQSKEEGYFLPLTSFNIKKHPEVLLKIINEYNNCK
jgi:hypothetical protein